MKYEIPREAFKQRLLDRLNFVLVDLQPAATAAVSAKKFENVIDMSYGSEFKSQFASQFPNKNQNIIVYSLQKNDETPAKAAEELSEAGYHFVYFYNGSPDDVVLDKGMN
jgi:rhodanese-related sulfurtransferase